MTFQPVPNTAQFVLLFLMANGDEAQMSVYVNNDAQPWDASQLVAKCNDLITAVEDSYVPALADTHSFVGVRGRDLEVQYGRVEEVFEPTPVAGAVASPVLPAHVAVRGTWLCAGSGAPKRGGIYLLPPTESQVTGDKLTAGAHTALLAALDGIHDGADANLGNAHVVVSRFAGTLVTESSTGKRFREPVKRATGITNEVTSIRLTDRVDSIRRRLPRSEA